MLRKLEIILLSVAIGLFVVSPVLAVTTWYNLEEYEELTGKKIEKFSEAPVLRAKVAAGELPPLEERLPDEPVVQLVEDRIGQYGGTWHQAWLGPPDDNLINKSFGELIIRYDPQDTSRVIPNIAKSWEISEGGKVYTFHLRKGLKWSDGVPFTADDILFYFEDVLSNEELTPVFPKWLVVGGEPAKFEKIDGYTVRFTFKEPYGLFLLRLAYYGNGYFFTPQHYAKQFHSRYTPMDELENKVKEAGYEKWYQLYASRVKWPWFLNPDHPTLNPWMPVNSASEPRFVQMRNPYYWKVDPEGNQLPYIDRVTCDLVANTEMIHLKAFSGEIDFQCRRVGGADYTFLKENEDKGDYQVLDWQSGNGGILIWPNLTCKDLVLRKIFQDVRFRKALSLAINREEVNEFCYQGRFEPRQASFVSGSSYFSEEWEKAYAEYDPQRANAFLDEMGLTKRDKEGFRLRPDGKTLSLEVLNIEGYVFPVEACELVKEYWKAIGIKVFIKPVEMSLFSVRAEANDYEIGTHLFDRAALPLADPFRVIPMRMSWDGWGQEYARWYVTKGKAGEKPPKDIARLQEIWDELLVTIDEKKRGKLVEELIQLHIKNVWTIGLVGEMAAVGVKKNNIQNVPEKLVIDDITQNTTLACTPQFFFDPPQ